MNNLLIQKYYNVLSEDFPSFINEYIGSHEMKKQGDISISCGCYYSKSSESEFWYSSLDHSIAVALIIWHFTKDKKQTLSGLFHDIATPAFKHSIDFMNNDYEKQETTENLTTKIIKSSNKIMRLLKEDKIDVSEVDNYHIYPIADNDTPMLSADRLEYTLSNGLGAIKKLWSLDEIKYIYSKIEILTNENGIEELGFNDIEAAKLFTEKMSELSICYMNDNRRFGMQFLADIIKIMNENKLITINDLYELSEAELIRKIESCDMFNISNCFRIWKEKDKVSISDKKVEGKYCVKIKAKKRYIDPLVKTESGCFRISKLSIDAKKWISNVLDYDFDRYLYMDFDLN